MTTSSIDTNSIASGLLARFRSTRGFTSKICEPLQTEDFVIQSMPDVSPTRWHIAHTTWFFETFLLKPHLPGYTSSNDAFEYLFNSYYNTVGEQFPRAKRGLLSRPSVQEVWDYRKSIDDAVEKVLSSEVTPEIQQIVEIGLQHEQQHQELMLTDIKHVLSCNPLHPQYRARSTSTANETQVSWYPFAGGVRVVGFDEAGVRPNFCFDNELPRHETMLQDFYLQDRLVSNREYIEFIKARGYQRPELWLSMGWATVQKNQWQAPMYWVGESDDRHEFTLSGLKPLDLDAPVCHVSFFEADAFARWSGHRLPTEFEWENAATSMPIEGNFADSLNFQPAGASDTNEPKLRQLFGDVWEWTSSPYTAYPGYQPPEGALGEYNGKFMCNQYVLRGGSCVTSQSHIRPTYRNFFPPDARWQFSGIRLAK